MQKMSLWKFINNTLDEIPLWVSIIGILLIPVWIVLGVCKEYE